jgi:hypothetical protein
MFKISIRLVLLLLSSSAYANFVDESLPIQFTNKELQAAYTLVRPELSQFEFHGEKGKFNPAPAIKFFGVDQQEFDVDLSVIGNILDLRFYHLRAQVPQLRFESGELLIELPMEDNPRAFRSALGSIGCRNAALIAALKWRVSATGDYRLVLTSVKYRGTLIGSGVFRSGLMLRQAKKLLLNVLENQLQKMLNKPEVQSSIMAGLLQWGRAYTGLTYSRILPNTLDFFEANGVSGIRYQAEP